jgi:glycosyltransferase involved in cell wall biosynthesis
VKVAFHVDQLWSRVPGGVGTYVLQMLSALPAEDHATELVPFHARMGHAPSIAIPASQGRLGEELTGSTRTLYPSWALLGRPPLPSSLSDCAIVHATSHAAVPPAGRAQRLVVTVHDLAFDVFPGLFPRRWRWLYRAGVRAAVRRADAILTPSGATRDDLCARYGADPAAVHVTPLASSLAAADGAPEHVLARLGVSRPFVLFAGTLEPRKNVVRLIRAYRRVAGSGLPHALVLAGPNGWGADEVERELALAGPGKIIRSGLLAAEDLDALYRTADAVAYPTLYEGFGLPVVEAMARGAPVVTSAVSSIPEVGGDDVVYVDPLDEASIAAGLERVLRDEELAAALRSRGPVRAARFSWAATARATLDVYRAVTGEDA